MTGSLANAQGANSIAFTTNSGSEALANGVNSLAQTQGANSVAVTTGNNSSAQALGNSSIAQTQGASSSAITTGSNSSAQALGVNSLANAQGVNSTALTTNTGSEALANGVNSLAQSQGANSVAITTGANSSAQALGNHSQAQAQGNYSSAITTGANSSAYAFGLYDYTQATGTGSTMYDSSYTDSYSSSYSDPIYDGSSVEVYGYYGFAGKQQNIIEQLGGNTSPLAQYDIAHGDIAGAAAAQSAFNQVQSAIASGNSDEVASGATWDSANIITWAASSAMNTPAELAAIEDAFDTWSVASGLTFKRVSQGADADIKIGFGDLNTATTGAIGFTTNQVVGTHIIGSNIELEDPNQNAFDADGTLTYAGTDATFKQVLLHEIGHALGLADNNNATSIENYYLGSANQSLSAHDVQAIESLYGAHGASSDLQSVSHLIAAMSQLASNSGATTTMTPNSFLPSAQNGSLMLSTSH